MYLVLQLVYTLHPHTHVSLASLQLPNCGRPSLPDGLWIYKLSRAGCFVDFDAVGCIKEMDLKDSDALPRFVISKSHPLHDKAEDSMEGALYPLIHMYT